MWPTPKVAYGKSGKASDPRLVGRLAAQGGVFCLHPHRGWQEPQWPTIQQREPVRKGYRGSGMAGWMIIYDPASAAAKRA